jgi:hypothetical protein
VLGAVEFLDGLLEGVAVEVRIIICHRRLLPTPTRAAECGG